MLRSRRPLFRRVALAVAAALGVAASAGAAPILVAEWDVAGSDGQTAGVLQTASEVSATALAPTGVTPWPGGFCCFTAASGWAAGESPDLGRYYEFTVTASPGYTVLFESLALALFRGVQGSEHGAESWELRASHDGFATTLAAFDLAGSAADEQVLFPNVDLSAVGRRAGTVAFRLYGSDYTSPIDYSGLGAQSGAGPLSGTGSNLALSGEVLAVGAPVPEPRSVATLALGLAMLAWAGRRRAPPGGRALPR